MNSDYKPYETKHFHALMKFFLTLGLYVGTKELITIKLLGGFEAFSGRASETWEHRVIVENAEISEYGIKKHSIKTRTVDQACEIMLNEIRKDVYEYKDKTGKDISQLSL